VVYDTGAAYAETAAGTAHQLLHGAAGAPTWSAADLTADVSGVLPIANGGTNTGTALTNKQLIVSSGGAHVELGAATNGQIPIGSTGNLPVLATPTSSNGITVTGGAGSLAISQTFGTDGSHAAAGNDTRLPPTPSGAGKILYDNASAYAETAAGTAHQVLHGAAGAPTWSAVDLTADVTGVLPVANGGTNSSTALTNNEVMVSSGGKVVELANQPSGAYYLQSAGGTNAPVWAVAGSITFQGITHVGLLFTPSSVAPGGTIDMGIDPTIVVTLTGSQTLTSKTLTSPAISSPAFSGTSTGTLTAVGFTLGGNLAAGGFKVTGLAAGSAAGDSLRYEQAGSAVVLAQVSPNGGAGWLNSGDYFGMLQIGDASHLTATNLVPWVAPCAGTLKNFFLWAVTATSGATNLTAQKATGLTNSPSYSAQTTVIAVANAGHYGSDTTHSITVAQGDLILWKTDATWNSPGFVICAQFNPG
jgi:hypothetical protein